MEEFKGILVGKTNYFILGREVIIYYNYKKLSMLKAIS